MSARAVSALVAAAVVLLGALTSLFAVGENEFAIRTRFGAIVETCDSPGLYLKLPWDQVVKLDRRILTESDPMQSFLTSDNRPLIMDFYIKWRVENPTVYFEATGGSERAAADRISEIVTDGLKSVVAQRTLEQIVTAERAGVTSEMLASSSRAVSMLGVRLVDVRVENIDLPDDVADRVYDRMRQDFAQVADRLRAQGDSSATMIRAAADRKRTEIVADAQRDALELKGKADAEAADIYAKAYSSDPEFYAFYRSLEAYERSLGKTNEVLVLTSDSEFFKYLKDPRRVPR
jgi:modulator of FtsH protease HflC